MVFLEFYYLASYSIMVAYMFRHYVFSFTALRHRSDRGPRVPSDASRPSVSIIIPAHNEEHVIGRLLQRVTELTYPQAKLEVIVVDDDSTDGTREIAESAAARHSGLIRVIHRNPGGHGKAAALNAGLRYAKGEFVGCLDADYLPQRDYLEGMVPGLLDAPVGAVQARICVLNEASGWFARIMALERLGGFRVSQYARGLLGLVPQFAGTVGLVPRWLLLSLGGFNPEVLAEDTDLTFRLLLKGWRTKYVNHVVSGEEAVVGVRRYWRQRERWAMGHMQCAFRYVLPLLRSRTLSWKQRLDGFMLLNVYFVPVLVLLSWGLLGFLLVFRQPFLFPYEVVFVSYVFFTLSGIIAPLLEVIVGAICEGRKRLILLTPMLILAYVLNMCICTGALLRLLFAKITGGDPNRWHKTEHTGDMR